MQSVAQLDNVWPLFVRVRRCTFEVFFQAAEEELRAELVEALSKKTCVSYGKTLDILINELGNGDFSAAVKNNLFRSCLTTSELKHLEEYEAGSSSRGGGGGISGA